MVFSINPATAIYKASGAASADVGVTMNVGERWLVVAAVNAVMIAQGTAGSPPTASLGNGSTLVAPGAPVIVEGRLGGKLAVIQVAAAGHVTVTRLVDAA